MKRWYNPKTAAAYLGTNLNEFNKSVRPYLIEIPWGQIGIRFDVVDLDNFADQYKSRYGRSGGNTWQENKCPDYTSKTVSGKSTNKLEVSAYEKAREQITTRKQSKC